MAPSDLEISESKKTPLTAIFFLQIPDLRYGSCMPSNNCADNYRILQKLFCHLKHFTVTQCYTLKFRQCCCSVPECKNAHALILHAAAVKSLIWI